MTIHSHKDLILWQKSMKLAREIFQLTKQLPKEELYVLSSQMRRAAISIPSNIAEGRQRSTRKDFLQFLRIAQGSASELETQLLLTQEFYPQMDCTPSLQLLDEVGKMLSAMMVKLSAVKAST